MVAEERHEILDTQTSVPMFEEDGHDMEPDELVQDDSQGDKPFDSDQTLPYMLGDDPDLTLPYVFGDDSISVPDSDSACDNEGQRLNSTGGSNTPTDGVIVTQPLGITQTSRTGRKFSYPRVSETDSGIYLGGLPISLKWLYVLINVVVRNL